MLLLLREKYIWNESKYLLKINVLYLNIPPTSVQVITKGVAQISTPTQAYVRNTFQYHNNLTVKSYAFVSFRLT